MAVSKFIKPTGHGLTSDSSVADRSASYHQNLGFSKDALKMGVKVNYRNMSQIARAKIQHEIESTGSGLNPDSLEYYYLPFSPRDEAIGAYYNNTPIMYDAVVDPSSVTESMEEVKSWYAKSLGFSEITIPGIDIEKNYLPAGTSLFGKALTSNITALHAVADDSIAILNMYVQPFQAIIPTEANIGKDVVFDVIPPYLGNAAAYFGTELQDLVDSDFDVFTRNETLSFMFCNGMISDAAIKLGRSAYPKREFLSLSTLIHQVSARELRERRLLGVNSDVRSPLFKYEEHQPGLNYAGIHEMMTNQSSTTDLPTVISGASVYTGTETATAQKDTLDNLMNTLAIKMSIANNTPNVIITDPNTFAVLRKGLLNYQYQVPPTPAAVFGISSIQYNLQGFQPMEIIVHKRLPRTSGQSALYMLNTKLLSRRVGWIDTMDLLGKYTNLSTRFAISSAETFIDKSDKDGSSTLQGAILGITHPYTT